MKTQMATTFIIVGTCILLSACGDPAATPAVDIKGPDLPKADDTNDACDIIVYEMTQHQKPKFYQGALPFKYIAGKKRIGPNETYAVYHRFEGWWTTFFYSDVRMKFSGIAEGARTIDANGRILAEAKMSQLLLGNGVEIEEFHYGADGNVRFYCKSRISFGLNEKESETDVRGKKERDYYFLWPASSF